MRRHALYQRADPAHFGLRTGGGYDATAAPIGDSRPHVNHVALVAERHLRIGQRGGGFRDRQGFAGQRRFIQLQLDVLDNATIGRHAVAGGQHHDVTRHKLLRGDLVRFTFAQHVGGGYRLAAQGGKGAGRLPFGCKANGGVQQDHYQDGQCFRHITKCERHARGHHQQADHEVGELPAEQGEDRALARLWQRIGAVTQEPRGSVLAAQAAVQIGIQRSRHLLCGLRVPAGYSPRLTAFVFGGRHSAHRRGCRTDIPLKKATQDQRHGLQPVVNDRHAGNAPRQNHQALPHRIGPGKAVQGNHTA